MWSARPNHRPLLRCASRAESPPPLGRLRPTRARRVLFVCGSLNQTTQMHAIARELRDWEALFTPYYVDGPVEIMRRLGLIENTIGGNKRRGWCLEYLRDHHLAIDTNGRGGAYDLVVTCSDVFLPSNLRGSKLVLVQEGIMDPDNWAARMCRRFRVLPRWFAGTALTGESFAWDRFCVASEGYRQRMLALGASPSRVVVTGIPNFDNCRQYEDNHFPHKGYVLVCTSDARETLRLDDRRAFLERCRRIAAGRQLVFKLHPNENVERATREIRAVTPTALVYSEGSAEEMVANANELITQWSSLAFVGLALGKEVHSYFPRAELERLCPVQNGGQAARNIASSCRGLLGEAEPSPSTRALHVANSVVA